MKNRLWLLFAAVTTLCWGVLGGFIELPEKAGFPATLGYSVWALTMVPCSLFALWFVGWKCEHDLRSVLLGFVIGSLRAGGQLLLFEALRTGPAYMVFPIVSLYLFSPCFFSLWRLKERASRRAWIGIGFSVPAMVMLSWQQSADPAGSARLWLPLAYWFLSGGAYWLRRRRGESFSNLRRNSAKRQGMAILSPRSASNPRPGRTRRGGS